MWRWREGATLRTPTGTATGGSSSSTSSPTAAAALAASAVATFGANVNTSSNAANNGAVTDLEEECLLAHMGLVAYQGSVLAIGGRHYVNGSERASSKVYAYNLKSDKWSEMRELPFPVCHASPVSMRLPNVL